MAISKILNPLGWNTPIVDTAGRPTPEFQKKWGQQTAINLLIPSLSTPEAVSAVMDVLYSTPGGILVRGSSLWGGLGSPNDATKFLNGDAMPAYEKVKDSDLSTSDITTNNVSTAKHGFAPKAPNDASEFLNGAAAYAKVKDSDLSTSDITTNNVSTAKHGFTPKLPNDAAKYLDGTGNYSTPAGTGGGGRVYASPLNTIGNVNDTGAFATLSNAFLLIDDVKVDQIVASFSNATIGNVYSAFIASISNAGVISATVATATAHFTTTATGLQSVKFGVPLTTLVAGQPYIAALVITSGTGTSVCGAVVNSTTGQGYVALPLDRMGSISRLGSISKRFWYTQNSDTPSSGTPVSNATTGNYDIGLRATL